MSKLTWKKTAALVMTVTMLTTAAAGCGGQPGTFGLNLCGFIDRDFIIAYVVTLAVIVIDYSIDTDEHNQYNYEKDGEHINPAEFLLFLS